MENIDAEIIFLKNSKHVGDRIEAMEREVKAWSNLTKDKILRRLASLGLKDRAKLQKSGSIKRETLYNSIRNSSKNKDGQLERITFSFARHGIFLEHGVGKNRPQGSASAAKAARKWITNVLPDEIEALADLLEESYGDIAAGTLVMRIPGIMDTKINIG